MRRTLIVAALMLLTVFAVLSQVGASANDVLITAFENDTYVSGEADETIVITNQAGVDVDVSGWLLRDAETKTCASSEGELKFPPGAVLAAGASWTITQDASAYEKDHKGMANWEWLVDSDPSVPQLTKTCGKLVLANSQDEVVLADSGNTIRDAVVYGGAARTVTGWSGDPIPKPNEGVVAERNRPETGAVRPDTDSAPDWNDNRITLIGQSHWGLPTFDDVGEITTCSSPDSSFSTVDAFIRGAQSSLKVELYELTNAQLVDAFQDALARNVDVRILMEGGPVGIGAEERNQENWILNQLVEDGAEVHFIITNDTQTIHDRYNVGHAKTAIRDDQDVLVMSGNWKPTGLPSDPTFGNREWCVVVASANLAAYLSDVFNDDSNINEYRDIIAFGTGTDPRYLAPPADFEPDLSVPTGTYAPVFPAEAFDGSDATVTPILSPDTSLFEASPNSLLSRIRNAEKEILVEQMSFDKHWGNSSCDDSCLTAAPSPLLDAVVEAARNGARVRVLLGDEFLDPDDTRDNLHTRDHLNQLADDEGLNMRARIVDSKIAEFLKVHNKGVLIDNETAYVGSFNWGRASAQDNREIGLLIDDVEVEAFFEEIFWFDWAPLENKPPTNLRADHVTIGESELDVDSGEGVKTTVHVLVNVTNTSSRGAGHFAVNVTVQGFLETTNVTTRVPFVLPGQTVTIDLPWTTTLSVGTFDLHAIVDALREIPETDEADNEADGAGTAFVPLPGVWL